MSFIPHSKVLSVDDARWLHKLRITTDDVCAVCGGAQKAASWQVVACSRCGGTGRTPVKLHVAGCHGHSNCTCSVPYIKRNEEQP